MSIVQGKQLVKFIPEIYILTKNICKQIILIEILIKKDKVQRIKTYCKSKLTKLLPS